MLSIRQSSKGILLFFLLSFFNQKIQAQNMDYKHPMSVLFDKGLTALNEGDTLTAFQQIQAAYSFSKLDDQVNYYYISLSLALDKPFAEKLANSFLQNSNNKIYKSRIEFLLGKY